MTFSEFRAQFPSAQHCIHLNHAGLSPIATPVAEAAATVSQSLMGNGDTLAGYIAHMGRERPLREILGRMLGVGTENLAFVRNTSHGLTIAAQALPLEFGAKVVCMRTDYPSTLYPWQARGAQVTLAEPDEESLLNACEEIRPAVLCASWVHWGTGNVIDLNRVGRFCRERNIIFVADIVQGLGALVPDLTYVDIAAAGCHKWLLTPAGIGVLYIRPELLPTLLPTNVGWNWPERPMEWRETGFQEPKATAARFEEGSPSLYSTAAFLASVTLLESVGFKAIEERVITLARFAHQKLSEHGMKLACPDASLLQSGIVGFQHPAIPNPDIEAILTENNVRVAVRAGWVRFSPHGYSTEEEIERAVATLP
ncbi:MAG: aminotransferase class V-fold PLP-dependent enzyme [Armatimonas sp.]